MTDTVAQLIAGAVLVGVAAVCLVIGYRAGKRRGMLEALGMTDGLDDLRRNKPPGEPRPPRPPNPPRRVH